jgi:cytosine/adenosine deaminase-related metal-dependent hydrolase
MILNNILLMDNSGAVPVNVRISGSSIAEVSAQPLSAGPSEGLQLSFENALAFPGLINSHDHLDFNLFPQLGNRLYSSYTEWGPYLHANYKTEIARVLKVPVELREQWGMLKNLLCGVTTVINHGARVKVRERLVRIYEQYHCLHSVAFEKHWRLKLNNPLKRAWPAVVHVGEGTGPAAHREIDRLTRWNLLGKTLIGVHGVAMSEKQAAKFGALVWCPQSNFFLLNQTALINRLKQHTKVLFGTDSTLTSHWNIWEHLRLARATKLLTDLELYDTLNRNPSATWKLQNDGIRPGNEADLVVTAIQQGRQVTDAFFDTRPDNLLLVMQQGQLRLFDESLLPQLRRNNLSAYTRVRINSAHKYVQADVPALMRHIRQYYPEVQFPVTAA